MAGTTSPIAKADPANSLGLNQPNDALATTSANIVIMSSSVDHSVPPTTAMANRSAATYGMGDLRLIGTDIDTADAFSDASR